MTSLILLVKTGLLTLSLCGATLCYKFDEENTHANPRGAATTRVVSSNIETCHNFDKSSEVAEMGDRSHNRHGPKRGVRLLCPFRGQLGPRLIHVAWAEVYFRCVFIHPAVWPQQTWTKNWVGWCALLSRASCVPIEQKVTWAEAYLHTKWYLSPSSRLATTEVGAKSGFWEF